MMRGRSHTRSAFCSDNGINMYVAELASQEASYF